MKILFLYRFPLWGNGSGKFLRDMCRALKDKGHESAIVSPETRNFEFTRQYRVSKIKDQFIPKFVTHPDLVDSKKYCELAADEIREWYNSFLITTIRAVEEFKPDIIHVHHVAILDWVAYFIKSIYNINFVVTIHGSDLHNMTLDKRYFSLTADALEQASYLLANSKYTKDWLVKMFNGSIKKHKTRIIPGGIFLKDFLEDGHKEIVNQKYNLEKKKVVLFTGRLMKEKGTEYLIRAAKNIRAKIFIIGDGVERENLEKLAKDLKLKNVYFVGYLGKDRRDEFHDFYRRADVFVAPSVWDEPLGLVILEAMVYKTPVVVTRKGGITLSVKDGYNGFFVRPRNSTDLAEKINILLKNKQLRLKMGENAYQSVIKKFDWSKIIRKFIRIYKRSLNGDNSNINR
ncbi:MAG: glycosyltransferase family 4 protein [Candidatus Jacksonbacteria bacterium]